MIGCIHRQCLTGFKACKLYLAVSRSMIIGSKLYFTTFWAYNGQNTCRNLVSFVFQSLLFDFWRFCLSGCACARAAAATTAATALICRVYNSLLYALRWSKRALASSDQRYMERNSSYWCYLLLYGRRSHSKQVHPRLNGTVVLAFCFILRILDNKALKSDKWFLVPLFLAEVEFGLAL